MSEHVCEFKWIFYVDHGHDGERVVRWCRGCGAYRIDTDIDNRIMHKGQVQYPDNYRKTQSTPQ